MNEIKPKIKFLWLIIILTIVVFINQSCRKEENFKELSIVEVINPPKSPEIYRNNNIEPKIKIKNTGTLTVTCFQIDYNIDGDNNGSVISTGPKAFFKQKLEPEEDTIITLAKWESMRGDRYRNGTHTLQIHICVIDSLIYYENINNPIKRIFTLEAK